MQKIIAAENAFTGDPGCRMAEPLNLTIYDGEQIAVVGDNAAGKTRLIETLSGRYPISGQGIKYDFSPSLQTMVSRNIRYIAFQDCYGDSTGHFYLQQRWNQQDIDEDTATVGSLLDEAYSQAESNIIFGLDEDSRAKLESTRKELKDRLYSMFDLDSLLDKYIITLSSGEMRKFQITKALFHLPRVLILDNPFIGLDASTRTQVADLLSDLAGTMPILMILVLSKTDIIPDFITHIIQVSGLDIKGKITREEFLSRPAGKPEGISAGTEEIINSLPEKSLEAFYPVGNEPEIIRCTDVSIKYGSRTILNHLNWTVHEGEHWAINGENGSGKSTLLSLVCADNPQSYACDIALFGHKRGSGESIWEIKRHIGYVSPEMHRAYQKNLSALDIVASGLFDTVGLFINPDGEQYEVCRRWMKIFGIEHLAERPYLKLSSGEQRLCLLARAFVKDPELLILDEPLHGLDPGQCHRAKQIIDIFVRRPHKTLVMITHYQEELPECIDHTLRLVKNH